MVRIRLRLGRYATDPVPVIRQLRASKPPEVLLATEPPTTDAERSYLLLFEEFKPTFYHGPELEPAEGTYDIEQLAIPKELLPVTGEYLQSLCDYSVINRELSHPAIDLAVPRSRQLFVEDEWAVNPTTLFVYPESGLLEAVVEPWPETPPSRNA